MPNPAEQSIAPRSPSLLSIPELAHPGPQRRRRIRLVHARGPPSRSPSPARSSASGGASLRRAAAASSAAWQVRSCPAAALLTMADSPGPLPRHDAGSVRTAMRRLPVSGGDPGPAGGCRSFSCGSRATHGVPGLLGGSRREPRLRSARPRLRDLARLEVGRPAVQRDPDADRAAFDAFSSGLAQATLALGHSRYRLPDRGTGGIARTASRRKEATDDEARTRHQRRGDRASTGW